MDERTGLPVVTMIGAGQLARMTHQAAVALGQSLRVLAAEGITRVFCEGGGQVAAGLLRGDLVDELLVFHAGLVLGAEGRAMIGALGLDRLAEAPRLRLAGTRDVGGDLLSRWVRG